MLIDSTDRDGELLLDPTNVEQAHIADIDTHAGSSRVPVLLCGPLLHRLGEAFIPDLGGCRIGERPINYHLDVLRQFGAVVEKRQDGLRLTAPQRPARRRRPPAVPERRCDRAGAAHRRARPRHHDAAQRGDRARDHGPHRDPAEDGRDHLGPDRPGDPIEGVDRLGGFDHLAIPDRIEAGVVGLRRAGHQRRHLRARGAAAADDDLPQRLPPHRRRVRRRRRGHPVLAPRRRRCAPSPSRPTCTRAS